MNATSIVRRIAFATILAATWAATTPGSAVACTPQYDPFGAVVGCCAANGTPMNDGAVCIDPGNPCRKNKCTAPSGSTPGTCTKNASYTATALHPKCLVAGDLCSVGECYSQACTYIGNQSANGFAPFCDDDTDCTDDFCDDTNATVLIAPTCTHSNTVAAAACADNPSAADPCQPGQCDGNGACLDTAAPDGYNCSGTTVDGQCQPRQCESGICVDDGTPITCTGTIDVCKQWQCAWTSQTTWTCNRVPKPIGTSCDTSDFDCKVQTCNSKGKCSGHLVPLPHFCDPERTNTTTILPDCNAGTCDNRGDCAGITYNDGYNGMACNDAINCTVNSICVEDPSGVGGACMATQASDCAPATTSCNCSVACDPNAGPPKCGCP
ncbi:MAG TPA: hypothetical protein VL049_25550 [Candidatus Dormibacteraeota bacterium]|nr:hypothetical protein [Candidatus Dormibacteraeota bacterium]